MPAILRLQHAAITVPTDALERARDFYTNVLGLTETPRPPELHDRPGIWYTFGATELHIQARDTVPPPGDHHPALVVDDIDAWRDRCRDLGVKMREQPTIFGRRRFDIFDPFGNRIELTTEGDQ
jgi:catechol 2,3-dioxygenase-like lactoylglutathione lyase family enzyme